MAIPEEQITVTVPGPVSTLAGAASQSSPVVAVRSRRWARAFGLGAGAVVLMSALVTVGLWVRGSRTPTMPNDEVAVREPERSHDVAAAPTVRHESIAAPAAAVSPAAVASGAASQPSHEAARAAPTTAVAPSVAPQPSHEAARAAPTTAVAPSVAPQPSRDAAMAAPKTLPVVASTKPVPERANVSASAASTPIVPSSSTASEAGSRSAPAAAAPKGLGELAIIVRPWASITLNGKDGGVTPYRENVPAGRYRIRIYNDDIGRSEIVNVTVAPNETKTVERKW
jgi:hypothetical protein